MGLFLESFSEVPWEVIRSFTDGESGTENVYFCSLNSAEPDMLTNGG